MREPKSGERAIDGGRTPEWGRASPDYARYRPGYPKSFYDRIVALGVALPGQRVLDLGTGTGNVARELALRGCEVAAIDISEQQVSEGRRLAVEQGLTVDFRIGPAEDTGLPEKSFDLVTASQCWLYFDGDRAVAETKRLLAPGGRLMTCHLGWLPRQDRIAKETEKLILKHNPDWTGANLSGHISCRPEWIGNDFFVAAFFVYEEPIPFTRETWRGRMRACRAVGAEMSPSEVGAFDAELDQMLETLAPENFTVLHWIDAHILAPTLTP